MVVLDWFPISKRDDELPNRLNLFGITGAARAGACKPYGSMVFCCVRERGAESTVPHALFRE